MSKNAEENEKIYPETRAVSVASIMFHLKKLLGESLTVVDASIVDKQQNKATKDLIRNYFRGRSNILIDISGMNSGELSEDLVF